LPDNADITDFKELLTAQGHFTKVDDWDAKHHRPTLDTLIQYDSVLVFGFREEGVDKGRWKEPDSLGDSLAEFALGSARKKTFKKGGIVIAGLSHALALGGKWRQYKMNPLLTGRPVSTPGLTLGQVCLIYEA
jgi:hypothetical protein